MTSVSQMTREIDPDYAEWRRKYPRFPGVTTCVELLKRRNVQGGRVETICADLGQHADQHADDLLRAARAPENAGVRLVLFHVIADAQLAESEALFAEFLHSSEPGERLTAARCLGELNTKEARRLLWENGYDTTGRLRNPDP